MTPALGPYSIITTAIGKDDKPKRNNVFMGSIFISNNIIQFKANNIPP